LKRAEAEAILKEKFKIDSFYDMQWEVISLILKKKRALFVAKTGYGKSLCYQFPAVLFDGLTVVYTPLVALMRDQVKNMQKLGIPAKSINYQQDREEIEKTVEEAKQGKLKILYI